MPDWHALFGNASAAQVALWIVAIAAVIGLTLKAWPTVRRFVKTVDALADLPEFIEGTKAQRDLVNAALAEVRHEVLPNNGGSMRDEQTRQSEQLVIILDRLDRDHARISALEDKDTP